MNKTKKLLLGLGLAFGFASAASAQTAAGYYLGAGVGSSHVKLDSSDFNGTNQPGLSTDERDIGYKLFGGYRYNSWLAAEVAFTDLSKAHASFNTGTADMKATSWSVAAVGTYPLAGGFSLLGKVGATYNKAETTMTCAGCGNATKSKSDVLWGLGAGYDFSPRAGLRLEYEDFGKFGESFNTGATTTGRYRGDLLSASLVYRF